VGTAVGIEEEIIVVAQIQATASFAITSLLIVVVGIHFIKSKAKAIKPWVLD